MISTVRTLMGSRSFESSLICLRSIVYCSIDIIDFIVHDDGTLTHEHQDRLHAEVSPRIKFVPRKHADEVVLPQLAKHPGCLAYRQLAPLALKLFDTNLIGDGPLVFADSDIYFRDAVTGFFNFSKHDKPIFMDNCTNSYSVRPWNNWPLTNLQLAGRINSGLIVGWTAGIDLDYINWVLTELAKNAVYHTRSYWVEQTCWAALAARTESRLFDPRQVVMASPTMGGVTSQAVAIHFVSTHRGLLANYQNQGPPAGQRPVEVRTIPARNATALDLLWSDLRRRF